MKQLLLLPVCLALVGCISAAKHKQQLGSTDDRELTLGLVQRDVAAGKSQAEVAAALGSPNIVTGDVGGREVWIYDKVATETSHSNNGTSVGTGSFGGVSGLAGMATFPGATPRDPSGAFSGSLSGNYYKSAGATSISQRTLTVVIKFTPEKAVESVSYNSTRF